MNAAQQHDAQTTRDLFNAIMTPAAEHPALPTGIATFTEADLLVGGANEQQAYINQPALITVAVEFVKNLFFATHTQQGEADVARIATFDVDDLDTFSPNGEKDNLHNHGMMYRMFLSGVTLENLQTGDGPMGIIPLDSRGEEGTMLGNGFARWMRNRLDGYLGGALVVMNIFTFVVAALRFIGMRGFCTVVQYATTINVLLVCTLQPGHAIRPGDASGYRLAEFISGGIGENYPFRFHGMNQYLGMNNLGIILADLYRPPSTWRRSLRAQTARFAQHSDHDMSHFVHWAFNEYNVVQMDGEMATNWPDGPVIQPYYLLGKPHSLTQHGIRAVCTRYAPFQLVNRPLLSIHLLDDGDLLMEHRGLGWATSFYTQANLEHLFTSFLDQCGDDNLPFDHVLTWVNFDDDDTIMQLSVAFRVRLLELYVRHPDDPFVHPVYPTPMQPSSHEYSHLHGHLLRNFIVGEHFNGGRQFNFADPGDDEDAGENRPLKICLLTREVAAAWANGERRTFTREDFTPIDFVTIPEALSVPFIHGVEGQPNEPRVHAAPLGVIGDASGGPWIDGPPGHIDGVRDVHETIGLFDYASGGYYASHIAYEDDFPRPGAIPTLMANTFTHASTLDELALWFQPMMMPGWDIEVSVPFLRVWDSQHVWGDHRMEHRFWPVYDFVSSRPGLPATVVLTITGREYAEWRYPYGPTIQGVPAIFAQMLLRSSLPPFHADVLYLTWRYVRNEEYLALARRVTNALVACFGDDVGNKIAALTTGIPPPHLCLLDGAVHRVPHGPFSKPTDENCIGQYKINKVNATCHPNERVYRAQRNRY